MNNSFAALVIAAVCGILPSGSIAQQLHQASGYPIKPVLFTDVTVADDFWSKRLEINRTVSIPYAFRQCVETGRIRNFEIVDSILQGSIREGKFCSRYGFDDSDVYKIIEGAAYSLHTHYDRNLDQQLDSLIRKIALAQEKDGYLYTMRTMNPEASWAKERWVNDRTKSSHELYNVGHLYEAAGAHYRATGKKSLLDVALKSADLLVATFGPGKMHTVPGHQVTEIGLAKLYIITGNKEYLDLAKFFIDQRGHGTPPGEMYNQDHIPVVEQSEAVGHAVRAGYLYAGMADVAALTGDETYIRTIDRIWDDVVWKKLYLTGGIGAAGNIEGFGLPYELPNLSAYCETCAAIANVYWNYRMFLRHGDAKYMDVVERVIYNGFLSGVGMSGDLFFYPNPLESLRGSARSPWFACACCPSNVVRFVPSIPGYVYAVRGDTVYTNLFIGGTAKVQLGSGTVTLQQHTRYPWDGTVRITVDPGTQGHFTLAIRIPGWQRNKPVPSDLYLYREDVESKPSLTVNGETFPALHEKGYALLSRSWKKGDTVVLGLTMQVHRVVADERIEDDRGKVAFERGPMVFCLEGVDNRDGKVVNLVVPDTVALQTEYRADLLGGVQILSGTAFSSRRLLDGKTQMEGPETFMAIPYYAWSHRGICQMTVWPAREPWAAKPLPAPTLAWTSTLTTSGGRDRESINDQLLPNSSNDHTTPYFHWWPKKGTSEWAQFDFPKRTRVSGASVYWFDDTGSGECRVPKEWKILYRAGNEWKSVQNAGPYGTEKDRMNTVKFDSVETDGVRLEVQLPADHSAGIYEWTVKSDR
jgi:uncharacterized protein